MVIEHPLVCVRPVAGSLSSDSANGYETLIAVYEHFLRNHPESARGLGASVVDEAFSSLYLSLARARARAQNRRGAFQALVASFRNKPNRGAALALSRLFLPRCVLRKGAQTSS